MELVVNMFNGQFDAADSLLPADSEPHMLYVLKLQFSLPLPKQARTCGISTSKHTPTAKRSVIYMTERRQDCLSCSVRSIPIGVKAAALKPKSVLLR